MVNNSKHMKDLNYKVLSVRLDDENIRDLKRRRQNFKSWNLLFKELLNNNPVREVKK